MTESAEPKLKPWLFVPVLYFMQAMPYAIVTEVSSVVYKDLGVDNASITKWTSLIALPWTIKLLWGPLVDLNSTKRTWVLATQLLIALGLVTFALSVQLPNAFGLSLGLLTVVAIFSATCDIATDGFYLLVLDKDTQAAFVGVQSTFFRLGRLFCTGVIVTLAGLLAHSTQSKAMGWTVAALIAAAVYGAGRIWMPIQLPKPPEDLRATSDRHENLRNVLRTLSVISTAVFGYFTLSAVVRMLAYVLAVNLRTLPLLGDLHGWVITREAFHREQIQLIACLICCGISYGVARATIRRTPMGDAFGSFFRQEGIVPILMFMLLYRFPEAMVGKISPLFFKDAISKGGMAMSTEAVGIVNGTFGVLGIVAGGILGGIYVSKRGLRKSFWVLALCMHLPNLLYLWSAATHPPLVAIGAVAFVDQFGYGVGYAAYAVYLMWVAQRGDYKTAHYAIGTGLGATFIMVAGILSGILQVNFGYVSLYATVLVFSIPSLLTLLLIPLETPSPADARRDV